LPVSFPVQIIYRIVSYRKSTSYAAKPCRSPAVLVWPPMNAPTEIREKTKVFRLPFAEIGLFQMTRVGL